VFDIEAVRGNDSNTLEAWAWRMESIVSMTIEAAESNGIPQRVAWKANTTVATGRSYEGCRFQYTWRSSTVESIDRSTTVGLEDGSVRASNGGKPNRLEVVSFTFKGLLPMAVAISRIA